MEVAIYREDQTIQGAGEPGDIKMLIAEMKNQNFDVIRFASYRTACKLRFIQKKAHLHSVDIWNMIEAFRENSLNTYEPRIELNLSRVESLVSSIYYQLNKRLPVSQQVDIEQCTSLLLNWLLVAYDAEDIGKLRVLSIKISLAIMCAGKIVDKLRYIFSLLSDANGLLIMPRLAEFLRELLALPYSVFESPSFHFTDSLPATIFDPHARITVNDFLDTFMSEPGPQCFVWVPLLHRLANVENVLHPVQCDGCNRASFLGFRYKCQRCYNYQLCQDCFWRGRVSGSHTNQHEMKEYTSYKSPSKQLGHSLRKSFRCVPEKSAANLPRFPDEPERTLNLSHIVPPSPMPSHNGFIDLGFGHAFDVSSLDSRSIRSPLRHVSSLDSARDEEHRLIARYAARLAHNLGSVRSPSELSLAMDTSRQKELVAQLEAKNREIMREIVRLRKQQEQEDLALQSTQNPTLLAELRCLRQRKEELEAHLSTLQESRRELMVQLEALMKMLKNHQASPRSTPNSSPHSGTSKSPPMSTPYPLSSSRSAPTTPGSNAPTTDSLTGVGGDVRMAFGHSGSSRSLRNDLLVAADSVTNAMSSLVRELNSEGSDDDEGGPDSKALSSSRDFETEDTESMVESIEGGGTLWREERHRAQENQFLAEIHARNGVGSNGPSSATEAVMSTAVTTSTTNAVVERIPAEEEDDEDDEQDDDQELYDRDPQKEEVKSS